MSSGDFSNDGRGPIRHVTPITGLRVEYARGMRGFKPWHKVMPVLALNTYDNGDHELVVLDTDEGMVYPLWVIMRWEPRSEYIIRGADQVTTPEEVQEMIDEVIRGQMIDEEISDE